MEPPVRWTVLPRGVDSER